MRSFVSVVALILALTACTLQRKAERNRESEAARDRALSDVEFLRQEHDRLAQELCAAESIRDRELAELASVEQRLRVLERRIEGLQIVTANDATDLEELQRQREELREKRTDLRIARDTRLNEIRLRTIRLDRATRLLTRSNQELRDQDAKRLEAEEDRYERASSPPFRP